MWHKAFRPLSNGDTVLRGHYDSLQTRVGVDETVSTGLEHEFLHPYLLLR